MNSLVAWIRQRLLADSPATASEALRAALLEQDRLTRDTHHQVQNSLQIVASMIALQAHDSETPEIRQAYAAIQAQIQTLTLAQRWMRDDGQAVIDLAGLLTELCAGLEASLVSARHPRVRISCTVPAIALHRDHATPAAFLVTELGIIAAAHSLPGVLELAVTATAVADRITISMACAGFAAFDVVTAANRQSAPRIILAMARQLGGSVQHDAVNGSYSVGFAASPA